MSIADGAKRDAGVTKAHAGEVGNDSSALKDYLSLPSTSHLTDDGLKRVSFPRSRSDDTLSRAAPRPRSFSEGHSTLENRKSVLQQHRFPPIPERPQTRSPGDPNIHAQASGGRDQPNEGNAQSTKKSAKPAKIADTERQIVDDLINNTVEGLMTRGTLSRHEVPMVVSASSSSHQMTILESSCSASSSPVFVFTFPTAKLVSNVGQNDKRAENTYADTERCIDDLLSHISSKLKEQMAKQSTVFWKPNPLNTILVVTGWQDKGNAELKAWLASTLPSKASDAGLLRCVSGVKQHVYFLGSSFAKDAAGTTPKGGDLQKLQTDMQTLLRSSAENLPVDLCCFPLAEYLLKCLQVLEPSKFSWMSIEQMQRLLSLHFIPACLPAEKAPQRVLSMEGARQFVRYLTERGSALIPEKSVDDLDASTPICTNVAWMHERVSNVRARKEGSTTVRGLLGRIGDENSRAGTIILLDRELIHLHRACFECSAKEKDARVVVSNKLVPTDESTLEACPVKCTLKLCNKKVCGCSRRSSC